MNRSIVVFLLAMALPAAARATTPFVLSLDDAPLGQLPAGWSAAKTGEGPGSVWKVVADATAPHGGRTSDHSPKAKT